MAEITRLLKSLPQERLNQILGALRSDAGPEMLLSVLRGGNPNEACAKSGNTTFDASVESPCFDELRSWRHCCPRSARHPLVQAPEPSSILSLPPLPLDAYTSQSHADTWTRTGWTRAHIRHLYDAILTWDPLPFCLVPKDLFLRDYQSGSDQFCSSALVHAILAIAARIVNENNDEAIVLPAGWFGSHLFSREAEALTRDRDSSSSLPDIQALGLLSLYHLRCGQEAEAQRLAEAFTTGITELIQRNPSERAEDQYAKVLATTHSGANFLKRYANVKPLLVMK